MTFEERVAEIATRWIGTPYRHQGSLCHVGADCLGLVRGVWRELYGHEAEKLQPYSPDWAETGRDDALLDAARRHLVECPFTPSGDLTVGRVIVFRWQKNALAKHLGITVSPDAFVHAYSGMGVVRSPLVPAWRRKIVGVFSFPVPEDQR